MSARPTRSLALAAAALTSAFLLSGCEAQTDADRQFAAARLRAATALTKVDPTLAQGAAETVARTTVESTSTPRAESELVGFEQLGDGRSGWAVVVQVQVGEGGLFGGSDVETRCYAYEIDADARTRELPSDEVDCP